MKEINPEKPVLVTGGSGYIASWIVKYLLEKGFTVRATVRDKNNKDKVAHLNELSEKFPGKLELFNADLLKSGSFKEAMQDCELVIHTASPFIREGIKDPEKELVEPALEGTKNVLLTANETPSVKRIVLTASVVSIYGDAIDMKDTRNNIFTEQNWNTTSTIKNNPYPYSKTVAEKEARKIAENQKQWDLVTIHPGFVLGPSITARVDSTSIDFMLSMINGKLKFGVPKLNLGVVDVRDVAMAHILAGTNPESSGRYILVENSYSMLDLGKILSKKYSGKYPLPKNELPNFMLYLVGPFISFSWDYIKKNIDLPLKFDNSRSINDLHVKYHNIDDTLNEHIEQIEKNGLLK